MSIEKLFAKITALFRAVKIDYMLVGGLAVAYWGYPRQSLDVDIVIGLNKTGTDDFIKTAEKQNFSLSPHEIRAMVKLGNRFVMEAEGVRLDCWLPRSEIERAALKNRKMKMVFGQKLYIISPEDLIISKLRVGRPRDLEDIKTVLLRQGKKLKKAYLTKQANVIGMRDVLRKLGY